MFFSLFGRFLRTLCRADLPPLVEKMDLDLSCSDDESFSDAELEATIEADKKDVKKSKEPVANAKRLFFQYW